MEPNVTSRDLYGRKYQIPVNQLTWRPAAYAIIVHDNQLLVMRERGGYHLPGGGINLGELPEAAVIREVKEETGLVATDPRLIDAISTFFTLAHGLQKHEQPEHVQSLLLYYLCEAKNDELSVDGQEEDEKAYELIPEWIGIKTLDDLPVGSSVDWRRIVRHALAQS
jgi:8-oxo-dGTP diphosphatase